jgi:Fe-S-cluster containining protein
MTEDERQVAVGLGFCHNQINTLARQLVDAAAEAGAMANVLRARGLITQEELDAERDAERARFTGLLRQEDFGIAISDEFPDKYAIPAEQIPAVDCDARYHLCRGACCALRFPLSTQDLDEGVVRWELGAPYLVRQGQDHRCVHQDRASHHCSIYEQRPGICRVYSCRNDKRIWEDFDRRVINPDLFPDTPGGRGIPHFPQGAAGNPPDMQTSSGSES